MGFDAVLRQPATLAYVLGVISDAGFPLTRLDDVEPVRRPYSRATIDELLAREDPDPPCRGVVGRGDWAGFVSVGACEPRAVGDGSINVVSVDVQRKPDLQLATGLWSVAKKLTVEGLVEYAYSTDSQQEQLQRTTGTLHDRLPGVYWSNLFGPKYVNLIGAGAICRAGWDAVEPVGGGFACYLYNDPARPPEDVETRVDTMKEVLGTGLFGVSPATSSNPLVWRELGRAARQGDLPRLAQ